MPGHVVSRLSHLPLMDVPVGTELIEEGVPTGRLYLVETGEFDVIRGGVRVVTIREPGAFLGEISALLGTAPTASVVARTAGQVRRIEDAEHVIRRDAELLHAIAVLEARRLQAVTAYLVDIQRQYAGTDSHLALMDQVLATLMTMPIDTGDARRVGSERPDVPDY